MQEAEMECFERSVSEDSRTAGNKNTVENVLTASERSCRENAAVGELAIHCRRM